jgi:hypothetical protein
MTRRVRMPDGRWWSVHRQHEMTQLVTRASRRERKLYLFFSDDGGGAMRRAEVPADFPPDAPDDELRSAWTRAEVLTADR